VAEGYLYSPGKLSHRRIRIPIDLCDCRFLNFEDSSIDVGEFKYVAVRVFRADEIRDREQNTSDRGSKRGPAGFGVVLEEAIRTLLAEGAIRRSDPQKVVIGNIQDWICRTRPGTRVPKDEVVRRAWVRLRCDNRSICDAAGDGPLAMSGRSLQFPERSTRVGSGKPSDEETPGPSHPDTE
jgi:hypothetical protein